MKKIVNLFNFSFAFILIIILVATITNITTTQQAKTLTHGNTYFVAPTGDDNNPGTQLLPFQTIKKGIAMVQNGDVLNIRAGTYRLMDEDSNSYTLSRPGATPTSFVTVQAYNGEQVTILGSLNSQGQTWQQYNGTLWRLPANFLVKDPTGMFNGETRIEHEMEMRNGARSHANITALISEGTWTKADAAGSGCGKSNDNCFIYFYPPAGEAPNSQQYEFSQRRFFYSNVTSYLVIRGLTFAYTQNNAFSIEGGRGQLIEDNVLSHNSNSNDNAYAIFISYGGGVHIHGNEVFDSKYWGGTPNSKGITLMVMDPNDPSIIEDNEVYDIVGQGITSKSGVSNIIVRRNYIHNVGVAVEPPGGRCHWTDPSCQPGDPTYYPGGDWSIYENIFVGNKIGVFPKGSSEARTSSNNNRIYNNVFYNNSIAAINISYKPEGTLIANNIFMGNSRAIYLNNGNGGTTRTVADFLPQFSSDNNLFFNNSFNSETADYFLRSDWTGPGGSGTGYTLATMQSTYNRELTTLAADPNFVNAVGLDFHLLPNSPARKVGDGSFYQVPFVDMGIYPNPPPATIGNLQVTDVITGNGVLTTTLNWNAPTNAVTYTLYISDALITESNFGNAISVTVPFTAANAGMPESFTTPVAYAGAPLYFAIRSQNQFGDWSFVSNNAFWPHWNIYLPVILKQ